MAGVWLTFGRWITPEPPADTSPEYLHEHHVPGAPLAEDVLEKQDEDATSPFLEDSVVVFCLSASTAVPPVRDDSVSVFLQLLSR